MKWNELYQSMEMRASEDQPNADLRDSFERMAQGEHFVFALFHFIESDEDKCRTFECPQDLHVKVLSVRAHPTLQKILAECLIVDSLPAGMRNGTYTLVLDQGRYVYDFPEKMFEEGEVPERELADWKETS